MLISCCAGCQGIAEDWQFNLEIAANSVQSACLSTLASLSYGVMVRPVFAAALFCWLDVQSLPEHVQKQYMFHMLCILYYMEDVVFVWRVASLSKHEVKLPSELSVFMAWYMSADDHGVFLLNNDQVCPWYTYYQPSWNSWTPSRSSEQVINGVEVVTTLFACVVDAIHKHCQ